MNNTYKQTLNLLTGLNLQGITKSIDEEINEAESRKISYLSFFNNLLSSEIEYRTEKRLQRNLTGAHFPVTKKLNDFKFGKIKGITKSDLANLMDYRWIDNHENLLQFGPPGLGKTHLAIGIGIHAIEKGYKVCFERISNLFKLLKNMDIQRKAMFRINRLIKADMVILDEIGYTPIEKREANLFFNLISELYEKTSIIITSNKSFEDWAEMMGDKIMTVALLDRLLHHSKFFSLSGESYRLKDKIINKKKEGN